MNRSLTALTAAAILLTGCAGPGPDQPATDATATTAPKVQEPVPTGDAGTPRGGAVPESDVDRTDPDAVADAVSLTAYRQDTRIDTSPMDSLRRAVPWLTADYATAVSEPMPGGGGADWLNLLEQDGYTTTTVEDAEELDQPPDTKDAAYRQRLLTITTHNGSGKATDRDVDVLWIVLAAEAGSQQWAVESINNSPTTTR